MDSHDLHFFLLNPQHLTKKTHDLVEIPVNSQREYFEVGGKYFEHLTFIQNGEPFIKLLRITVVTILWGYISRSCGIMSYLAGL